MPACCSLPLPPAGGACRGDRHRSGAREARRRGGRLCRHRGLMMSPFVRSRAPSHVPGWVEAHGCWGEQLDWAWWAWRVDESGSVAPVALSFRASIARASLSRHVRASLPSSVSLSRSTPTDSARRGALAAPVCGLCTVIRHGTLWANSCNCIARALRVDWASSSLGRAWSAARGQRKLQRREAFGLETSSCEGGLQTPSCIGR